MFNRAWLAGGIPRTACVAAYEPICAVSLADSYINRANPGVGTLSLTAGSPSWADATGITLNGSTYYSTGITCPANEAWSFVVRYGAASVSADNTFPSAVGNTGGNPNRCWMTPNGSFGSTPGISFGYGSGRLDVSGKQSASGCVMALSSQSGYLNGAAVGALGGSPPTSSFTIQFGRGFNVFAGDVYAVYIYNAPLTPTQVRAVTDAMNMLPMRPRVPAFPSWLRGAALTQFRKLLGLRTGSRGVSE